MLAQDTLKLKWHQECQDWYEDMLVNVFLLAFFSLFLIGDAIDNVIALFKDLEEHLNLLEKDSQGSKLSDQIDKRQGIVKGYKK